MTDILLLVAGGAIVILTITFVAFVRDTKKFINSGCEKSTFFWKRVK